MLLDGKVIKARESARTHRAWETRARVAQCAGTPRSIRQWLGNAQLRVCALELGEFNDVCSARRESLQRKHGNTK
jgi:hypothetical protein